jgi:enoyl-CoA hydratase
VNRYELIRYEERADGLAVCTLDRPEVRNALNEAMVEEIRSLLRKAARDPNLRVLILAGGGEGGHLAGADVRELRDRRAADALRRINSALFRELEQFPRPTIAVLRGVAVGGGLELAMACDLRVCAEDAKLGQPEVGIGIIPGAGATYRLPRLVGLGRAKEIIFTGRIFDGREAYRIGLVDRVVPRDRVMAEAESLGRKIADNGELAVRLAKIALNAAFETSIDAGLALESSLQAILFDDDEKIERMTRFLEKKK